MTSLAEVQGAAERARGEGLLRLQSDRASSLLQGSVDLAEALRALAIVGFLLDADIDGFHRRIHLAAGVRRRFFELLRAGLRCPDAHPLRAAYPALEEALASGEPAILADLARHQATSGDAAARTKEAALAAAVSRLAEGQTDDAIAALTRFEAARDPEQEGLSILLSGITRSDEATLNAGLATALAARHASFAKVDTVERWIAVDLLGLARLARWRGLEITVADALIPAELLEPPEVAFPDVATELPPFPRQIVDDLPRASA